MFNLSQPARRRLSAAALVAVAAVFVGASYADARTGKGFSFGSRGDRTYTAPPTTRTMPTPAAPVERSITQPGRQTAAPTANVARPGMTAPAQSRWGNGFGGLLMGGLLGAGLFGLLSGAGLFAGLGSLAGVLGFVLQVGLIAGLAWLALALFRSRQNPAMAGAGNGLGGMAARNGLGGYGAGANSPARGSFASGNQLALGKDDFDAFERLLQQIQTATSQENLPALRALLTPEMVNYVLDDIADNSSKGLRNAISDVRLLSGDLSEGWRERDAEYATVAMRFELIDTMVDRATGRVVEGNPNVPTEATEAWTFRRAPNSGPTGWRLSAIQQRT